MKAKMAYLLAGALMPLVPSCSTSTTPAASSNSPTVPSQELYPILQQFLAADTLNNYPKVYAAFVRPDTVANRASIQLWDEYNSGERIKSFPLTVWKVDGKIIFVFTSLEAVAVGGDTTHYHLIRETARANQDKIWSPALRCWRIDVENGKIVYINRQVPFASFHDLTPLAPPPPPPVLTRP